MENSTYPYYKNDIPSMLIITCYGDLNTFILHSVCNGDFNTFLPDPGLMASSMAAEISLGAGLPGMRAVVMIMSLSLTH